MKHILFFIALTLLPLTSHAALSTYTEASAETGGVSAAFGEVVVTGSSSASSEVHTNVRGGNSGGSVEIEITTEVDGVVKKESVTKTVPPGGAVIEVATSSASAGGEASATAKVVIGGNATTTPAQALSSSTSARIWKAVTSWFGGFEPARPATSTATSTPAKDLWRGILAFLKGIFNF